MKVLVTCPPMLKRLDDFRALFAERGADVHAPDVVQTLPEAALEQLVPAFDGWIIGDDPATRRVLAAGVAGRLRAAVKWGVGVDNVDLAAARDLGLPIVNTPAAFGREVADLAMCYTTAIARDVGVIDRGVRAGDWPKPAGVSLADRTVALVGLGDIGRHTARRLMAADMRVIAYDPFVPDGVAPAGVERADWPERLSEADFVVLTCALTPQNRTMVNAKAIAAMKPGVRIVNVARGALIDEAALITALAAGHVAAAALDVFEVEPLPAQSPLRRFERCVLGSHNASNTVDAVRRASERAISSLFELLAARASR